MLHTHKKNDVYDLSILQFADIEICRHTSNQISIFILASYLEKVKLGNIFILDVFLYIIQFRFFLISNSLKSVTQYIYFILQTKLSIKDKNENGMQKFLFIEHGKLCDERYVKTVELLILFAILFHMYKYPRFTRNL